MKTRSIILTLLLCILTTMSYAQTLPSQAGNTTPQPSDVPRIISYQGLVRATNGQPITDSKHNFIITLYADEAGTMPVWTDSYDLTTDHGIFNVLLGGGQQALPAGDQLNRALWVGVRLDGQDEMRPLSQLVSSPFALNVADNSIATNKLQDSAVTAEKMGTNYVAGIAVNGVPVLSKGAVINLVDGANTSLNFDTQSHSIIVNSNPPIYQTSSNDSFAGILSFNNGGKPKVQATVSIGTEQAGYATIWSSTLGSIDNSHLLDAGGYISVQTGAGSGSAKLTITESNGNFTTDGYVNTGSVDGYKIGGASVLTHPGSYNNFVGDYAGNLSLTGYGNTAAGSGALMLNSSGDRNSAVGFGSMNSNTTGAENNAMGDEALYNNLSGDDNIALGFEPLFSNIDGSFNIGLGFAAIPANTSGSYNIGIGSWALTNNITGTYNIGIGYSTLLGSTNLTNTVAIGTYAQADISNVIILGAYENVGINSNAPSQALEVGNAGNILLSNVGGGAGQLMLQGTGSGYTAILAGAQGSTNITYTLPTSGGTSGQFLTYGTSGALSWSSATVGSVTTDATLSGDGSSGAPLGINLSNANTWSARQTLPSTSGQGNALINSINASTTSTIDATHVTAGTNNTFLTTDHSGVVGFNALSVDLSTLKGDGSSTPLAIDLTNANTWLNTIFIAPAASNIPSLVVQQNTAATPSSDIFEIESSGGTPTKYLFVDNLGNTFINTSTGIVHSTLYGELSSSSLSLTADASGILPIANGGTNSSTALSGSSIIISDGTSLKQGGAGSTTEVLHGNASGAPTYSAVDLTSDVGSSILRPVSGGTGLDGSVAANGALLIGNGTGFSLNTLTPGVGIIITNSSGNISIAAGSAPAGVTTDLTLVGDGVSTNLGINTDHSNTWTNEMIVAPGSSYNVPTLVLQQSSTTSPMPSHDVFDIQDHTGLTNYVSVDRNFNTTIYEDLQIGNVAGITSYNGHIKAGGKTNTAQALSGAIGGGTVCTDIAGRIHWVSGTGNANCLDVLYIPVAANYGSNVAVVISGEDCPSASLVPYARYSSSNNRIYIGISRLTALPANNFDFYFDYHVIEIQ